MRITSFMLLKKLQRRAAAFVGLAGVFLFAVGTPAWAATYYLAPGGNDSNAGTSLGTAWLTLSKVNSTLQAGDVVLIQPGTYSGGIAPVRDGGASSRISYVGSLASPGAAVVASINLTGRSYISVKGVTSTGDLTINAGAARAIAQHDSILNVIGRGSFSMSGAQFCYVGHSTIGDTTAGHEFRMNEANVVQTVDGDHTDFAADTTKFCTLEDNVFYATAAPRNHCISLSNLRGCEFNRNQFNISLLALCDGGWGMVFFTLSNTTFTDNKFIQRNACAGTLPGGSFSLRQRDHCRNVTFLRDTFLVSPQTTYPIKYYFTTGGNTGSNNEGPHKHFYLDGAGPLNGDDWLAHGDARGSCGYNKWVDCYFQGDGYIGCAQTSHRDTITGTTFAMKQSTGSVDWKADSLLFRHNTYINTVGPQTFVAMLTGGEELTNSAIEYNIFRGTGVAAYGVVDYPVANHGDYNLVYSPGAEEARAIDAGDLGQSAPGTGHNMCTVYGNDCNSLWGDPQLGSVAWASADPTPQTGSIAFSSSLWPDGYVGAIRSGTSLGDLSAPAAVGDLALALISDHTVVLRWTATGDDGTTGTATAYDLRWSNQPITASNFATATPVGIQPVPAVAGSAQNYVLADLTLSTNYYFALKVRDESNNWSDLSNVLGATTKVTDTVPPASITFGP